MPSIWCANDLVLAALRRTFHARVGGLYVFAGPRGAGKSCYLHVVVDAYRRAGQHVCETTLEHLLLWGAKPQEAITQFVRSDGFLVVVVDNVRDLIASFSANMRAAIWAIAAEGRRSARFAVVLAVSDASLMRDLLLLNKHEPEEAVSAVCHPSTFDISACDMRCFLRTAFPELDGANLSQLTQMLTATTYSRFYPSLVTDARSKYGSAFLPADFGSLFGDLRYWSRKNKDAYAAFVFKWKEAQVYKAQQ